jgi:hypothetical protein
MYGYKLPIDALRVLREGEHEDIMNYIKMDNNNILGIEIDPYLLAIQKKMNKLLNDDENHSGGSWCFTLSIVRAVLCGTYTDEELLADKRKEDEEYELFLKRREEQEQYQRIKERVAIREKELEIELAEQKTETQAKQLSEKELSLKKDELAWEAWDAEREERSASKVCRGNRGSI